MPLSDEDKQRIYEEELERAEARRRIEREERGLFGPGSCMDSCAAVFLLLFLSLVGLGLGGPVGLIIGLAIFFVLYFANNRK